jgi:hypothetical protein
MRRIFLALLLVIMSSTLSFAGKNDLDIIAISSSAVLEGITKDIGYLIAIPSMTPSDPMGLPGFDIGVEASGYKLDESKSIFGDNTLPATRLHLQKGLPANIDIGLEFATIADSNIKSVGGEIRYALMEDGVTTPAIGLRATYSELNGVDNFDLSTYTLGAQISKEVVFITPYAGATYLSSKGEVSGAAFGSETVSNENVYVGVNLSALVINLALQADFSDGTMYTIKLSAGW